MIYFSGDKISNSYLSGPQTITQTKVPTINLEQNKDLFVSATTLPKVETNDDKKRLIAYILGGTAALVGIIFAIIKLKKGKAPSGDIVKDITEGTTGIGKKSTAASGSNSSINTASHSLNNGGSNTTLKRSSTRTANATVTPQEKAMADKVAEQNERARQAEEELKRVKAQKAAEKQQGMEQVINEFINATNPKDEKIAREAFPQLTKYSEKLGISISDYNAYLQHITTENKNFAINEGIPLIAENMNLIKKISNEPSNIPRLLQCLNKDNKDVFSPLLENAEKFEIDSIISLGKTLRSITPQNKSTFIARIKNS